MAVAFRAAQLGETMFLNNPVLPYETSSIICEHRCEI
jgi:hypothetical protein